jgi:hypothetical protein
MADCTKGCIEIDYSDYRRIQWIPDPEKRLETAKITIQRDGNLPASQNLPFGWSKACISSIPRTTFCDVHLPTLADYGFGSAYIYIVCIYI